MILRYENKKRGGENNSLCICFVVVMEVSSKPYTFSQTHTKILYFVFLTKMWGWKKQINSRTLSSGRSNVDFQTFWHEIFLIIF